MESVPTEITELCLRDKILLKISSLLKSSASHLVVTLMPNVLLFFHQGADNNSNASAKTNSLKRSYEIISLCKSIKITSVSLSIERLKEGAEVVEL